MSLITPCGSLTYLGPLWDGITTQYGLSRDWRFEKSNWQLNGLEFIEPLKCVAPWSLKHATDMTVSGWSSAYNADFRQAKAMGTPAAAGAEFYDGSVYAANTAITTFCGQLGKQIVVALPQLMLRLFRCPPPPGQGVIPQTSLTVHGLYLQGGEWVDCSVTLWLPYHHETYNRALVWCHVADWESTGMYNILNDEDGFCLGYGPTSGGMHQSEQGETWILETLEVWRDAAGQLYGEDSTPPGREFCCTHILIRRSVEADNWWVITRRDLRLYPAASPNNLWVVSCGGCRQWFNLSRIMYSWPLTTVETFLRDGWPNEVRAIPDVVAAGGDADAWNDDPTYSLVYSQVSGWTVTVEQATPSVRPWCDGGPYLLLTPADNAQGYRPVVWVSGERHDAVIDDEVRPETPPSTDGGTSLVRLRYTLNKSWKGASGSAEFETSTDGDARYDTWKANAKLNVLMGWQAGAGAGLAVAKIAEAYTKPDGFRRFREGNEAFGFPGFSLEFGDFAEVRASRKEIMDLCQAGGMTISAWAHMIANRMGICTDGGDAIGDLLYVDDSVASMVIPTETEIPSLPTLAPQDGQTYLSHIQAVEKATGIRVGFNRQVGGNWYLMMVDDGPPDYDPNTSTVVWSVDYNTLSPEVMAEQIESTPAGGAYRNVYKLKYGRPKRKVVGVEPDYQEAYWSDTLANRKTTIGDDWGAVITDSDAQSDSALQQRFIREHWEHWGRLRWRMPMRNDVLPDAFIEITDLPGIGSDVATGYVYQITEAEYEIDGPGNEGTVGCKAELVYVPA